MDKTSGKKKKEPWDWLDTISQDTTLPTNPDPEAAKPKENGIIQRVTKQRRLRQEAILDKMHKNIGDATKGFAEEIIQRKQQFKQELDVLKSGMEGFGDVSSMVYKKNGRLQDIESLADEVQHNAKEQIQLIDTFFGGLEELEKQRAELIKPVMTEAYEQLWKTATLIPGDVDHIMALEAEDISKQLVQSQQAILDGKACLKEECFDGERRTILMIACAEEEWRKNAGEMMAMQGLVDIKTTNIDETLADVVVALSKSQEDVEERRKQLLKDLPNLFKPPSCSRDNLSTWCAAMRACCDDSAAANKCFSKDAEATIAAQTEKSTHHLADLKAQLTNEGFFSQEQAEMLLPTEECQQAVDQTKEKQKAKCTGIETAIIEDQNQQRQHTEKLCTMLQSTADVYEENQTRLNKVHQDYQGDIEKAKSRANITLEALEKNVQTAVVAARQCDNDEELQKQDEYIQRQVSQLNRWLGNKYRDDVMKVIDTFQHRQRAAQAANEKSLMAFFALKKNFGGQTDSDGSSGVPKSRSRDRRNEKNAAKSGKVGKDGDGTGGDHSDPNYSLVPPGVNAADFLKQFTPIRIPYSGGEKVVFMIKDPGKRSKHSRGRFRPDRNQAGGVFLTEAGADDPAGHLPSFMKDRMDMDDTFNDMRRIYCELFLHDMYESEHQQREQEEAVVNFNTTNLDGEIRFKKVMQESRSERVQDNIINARQSELEQHKNRIDAHTQQLQDFLMGTFAKVHDEWRERMEAKADTVSSVMAAFTEVLQGCSTLEECQDVFQKAKTFQQEFLQPLEGMMDGEKAQLLAHLEPVREPIQEFGRMAKGFKQGGTFSSKELSDMDTLLFLMSEKVDAVVKAVAASSKVMLRDIQEKAKEGCDMFHKCHAEFSHDLRFKEARAKALHDVCWKIRMEADNFNGQVRQVDEELSRLANAAVMPDMQADLSAAISKLADRVRLQAEYLHCFKKTPRQRSMMSNNDSRQSSLVPGASQDELSVITITQRIMSNFEPRRAEDKPKGVRLVPQRLRRPSSTSGRPTADLATAVAPAGSPHAPVPEGGQDHRATAMPFRNRRRTRPSEPEQEPEPQVEGANARQEDEVRPAEDVVAEEESPSEEDDGEPPDAEGTDSAFQAPRRIHRRRKYLNMPNFGEDYEDRLHPTCFMPQVRRFLRACRAQVLKISEVYYLALRRNPRETWCPEQVLPTIDECMTDIDSKLQDARSQGELFHRESQRALRQQVISFMEVLQQVTPLLLQSHHTQAMSAVERHLSDVIGTHKVEAASLEQDRVQSQNSLKPEMCERARQEELSSVDSSERARQTCAEKLATSLTANIQTQLSSVCKHYFKTAHRSADDALQLLDGVPLEKHLEKIEDEVIDVMEMLQRTVKPWSTGQRDKDKAESAELVEALPSRWPHSVASVWFQATFPKPFEEEAVDTPPSRSGRSRSSRRLRSTDGSTILPPRRHYNLAQLAVVQARDQLATDFIKHVTESVETVQRMSEREQQDLKTWRRHWHASVTALQRMLSTMEI